jgi:glycerophosphoryl diester phosphodiesterase
MGAVSDASDLRTAVASLVWVLGLAGVIWLWGIVKFWHPLAWPEGAMKLPKFQAHRGFRPGPHVVENTRAAFRLAKEAGAEMAELDVQLTKDGEAIVFHDEDLKRLGGSDGVIAELTAKEIQARVEAPLLKEVLLDPEMPRLLNVELKWTKVRGAGLEEAVVRAIRETRGEERILFSSFNPFVLRRLSKLAPAIPRGLLVCEDDEPGNHIWLKRMWLGFLARPHLLHLDQAMITPERMERWKERGIPVAVWTVNDSARAHQLLRLGVVSVISDTIFSESLKLEA